jgi:hypothetical protein
MKCAIETCGVTAGGFYGVHLCRQHDQERFDRVGKAFYANYTPPKPYDGLGESFWKTKLEAAILRLTQQRRDAILLDLDRKTGQVSVW